MVCWGDGTDVPISRLIFSSSPLFLFLSLFSSVGLTLVSGIFDLDAEGLDCSTVFDFFFLTLSGLGSFGPFRFGGSGGVVGVEAIMAAFSRAAGAWASDSC